MISKKKVSLRFPGAEDCAMAFLKSPSEYILDK